MQMQIEQLSPHQNGKVFGVLTAIVSFIFLAPFTLVALATAPQNAAPPIFLFLLFPLIYMLLSYAMVAIGCWLYNRLFRHIGGIEFKATSTGA